jgi:hypothetical protein
MIRPTVPILAKCEPDKSKHHQDGSGYHQPVWIVHRLEKRDHFRASALPANVADLGLAIAVLSTSKVSRSPFLTLS